MINYNYNGFLMSTSHNSDLFAEPLDAELKLAAQVPSLLSCSIVRGR